MKTSEQNDPTVEGLFRLAIAVEKELVTFYCRLRQLFRHEKEVADFWIGLRNDEIEHIVELERILAALPPEARFSPADEKMLKKSGELLEALRSIEWEPVDNLDVAYELANKWENSEVNWIFLFLAQKFIPREDRKKVVEMMIDEHLERLMEFPLRFSSSVRKKIVPWQG